MNERWNQLVSEAVDATRFGQIVITVKFKETSLLSVGEKGISFTSVDKNAELKLRGLYIRGTPGSLRARAIPRTMVCFSAGCAP